jgi:hypothetical protein
MITERLHRSFEELEQAPQEAQEAQEAAVAQLEAILRREQSSVGDGQRP